MLYRGTGHDEDGIYSEKGPVYRDNMTRLKRKIESARGDLPQPIIREEKELEVGIIYYGSMENTIQEIDDILESTVMKVSQCRGKGIATFVGGRGIRQETRESYRSGDKP